MVPVTAYVSYRWVPNPIQMANVKLNARDRNTAQEVTNDTTMSAALKTYHVTGG